MLMPEASVHEDRGASAWENYIGIAGQVFPVKPVTVACLMQEPPDFDFRLRALRLDGAHNRAPLLGVEYVHHSGANETHLRSRRDVPLFVSGGAHAAVNPRQYIRINPFDHGDAYAVPEACERLVNALLDVEVWRSL